MERFNYEKHKILNDFAKKWNVSRETIDYIEYLLKNTGNSYGKVSRTLLKTNITISPRQLKYFKGKVHLVIILRGNKPANWSVLLRRN